VNTNNSIIIKAPNSVNKTIPYDYLVIANGYKYSSPFKSDENNSILLRKKEINSYFEKIQNAKKILVVGSGPAGIEQAGEIAHYFPST